ncbi:MAG: Stk1 family PASTA domain-containing Ser/Thr kinase [Oscillospiraceae bacterium]|nr:Stk1 family PASTA domain-containing Ser/Thr kinase [Oscillospiraceae bacterium]
MNLVGKLFAERYEIIAEIGNGGMANVFKAKDTVLGRFVAIKILRTEFLGDEEFTARFTAEAQAAAGLGHQNLVAIHDVGVWLGHNYIVMEFVDGITLKDFIKQNAPIKWQDAAGIATQVLQGIAHAHKKGIIHRDIKPQNIMLTDNGIVKVMDFGIARAASNYTMKIGDTTIGSVHYFSPEQARGRHTDEKSDIYSLGVVLYEMLTGTLPFENESPISIAMMHLQKEPISPKDVNITVPLAINDVVLKAMRKDTADRYQSAKELWQDLQKVLSNPDENPVLDRPRDSSSDTRIMQAVKPIVKVKNEDEILKPSDAYQPRRVRKDKERNAGRSSVPAPTTEDDKYKEKSKKLNKIALISFLAMGGVICFAVIFSLFPNMFLFGNRMPVPEVVGKQIEEVLELFEGSKDIEIEIIEERYIVEKLAGEIFEQSPNHGTEMKTPIKIKVRVSLGPEEFTLPNLKDMDERDARKMLEEKELKVRTVYESNLTIAQGIVIKTKPEGGTPVKGGDEIEIIVSAGSEGKEISMPNLIGMTRDKAKETLEAKNLILGRTTWQDSAEYDEDVVISQSVASGSTVKEFSTIDIVRSTGKAPSPPTQAPPPTQRPVVIE